MFEYYQNRERRDARYAELKRDGYRVKRSTHRGQVLHPMYVKDYPSLPGNETGFGNDLYRTLFPILYILEIQ
jgi:hypothetical protein